MDRAKSAKFWALFASVCLFALSYGAQAQEVETFSLHSHPIEKFHVRKDQSRFGAFTFVGGLIFRTRHENFGGLSGFRYLDGKGQNFIAVSDFGYVLTGQMQRDEAGRPTAWQKATIARLPNREGQFDGQKSTVDAEAVEVIDGKPFIAFERFHRIQRFDLEGGRVTLQGDRYPHPIPPWEIRVNQGFEALVKSRADTPLKGALVVFTEGSINKAGDIFAGILSGPRKGVFFVKKSDDFNITDAVSLPNGDILILERRFDIRRGIAMRLRQIDIDAVKPNATVDGKILLEADFAFQIDNMEGMDVWRDDKGQLRLGLISDDNRSFLQRSLYLEFLMDEAEL